MIRSITYFENEDMSCQIGFGYQEENYVLKNNPPFISVGNLEEGDDIWVENTHEYSLPIGIDFWRIKYK